jgi:hypothetical protein
MVAMRSLLPIVSVILALIAAGSIAYIAWELSSGDPAAEDEPSDSEGPDQSQDQDDSQ